MSRNSATIRGGIARPGTRNRCLSETHSAVTVLRAWFERPTHRGLVISCLFHVLVCVVLALCVWAAPRPGREPDLVLSLAERADHGAVRFELGSVDPDGGGGGATPLFEETAIVHSSVAAGGFFEPGNLALPAPDVSQEGMRPGPGLGHGRGTGRGDGTGGGLKAPGKNAVSEGSFTVWTIPEDPLPGQSYTIMIEVNLPERITRYPRSDLSGMVVGTDGWRQPLPGEATPPKPYLAIENHAVQLQVDVPGGGRLVQDIVQVRSRLLKEQQVLKIVF